MAHETGKPTAGKQTRRAKHEKFYGPVVQQHRLQRRSSPSLQRVTDTSSSLSERTQLDDTKKRTKKCLWFFRRISSVSSDDSSLRSRSSSSQELELTGVWEKSTSSDGRKVLCIDDDDDLSSKSSDSSSMSTMGEMRREDEPLVVLEKSAKAGPGRRLRVLLRPPPPIDLDTYMAKRQMTATQERWNALTMIPSPLFCLYFLLSGCWVSQSLVLEARKELSRYDYDANAIVNGALGNVDGCLPTNFYGFEHKMHALPPLPVLAVAIGIIFHAPFSFLYHWKYAHALPPGAPRTTHWSRRMDQSMIHFASACFAYATSGSWDFFLANALYNLDCIYRQFKTKVRPRRNQIRISISFLFYTIPFLRRGDFSTFAQFWIIMGISGWLFAQYPIGGWSHAAFHLVVALEPPILMMAAATLPASQEQIKLAATCAALAQGGL